MLQKLLRRVGRLNVCPQQEKPFCQQSIACAQLFRSFRQLAQGAETPFPKTAAEGENRQAEPFRSMDSTVST